MRVLNLIKSDNLFYLFYENTKLKLYGNYITVFFYKKIGIFNIIILFNVFIKLFKLGIFLYNSISLFNI